MIATPANVTLLAQGLDHPECICFGPDGALYAGGEAGQLYRISPEGEPTQIATTGGFLLGIAADGSGAVHVCDTEHRAVFCVGPEGTVTERSRGTAGQPFTLPNFPVFNAHGDLYVSDSGEYWDKIGTGKVFVIRPNDTTEIFHHGPFRFANGLAIDPTQTWLYAAQSTAGNVVRIPLDRPDGSIEVTHILPPHSVPDGLAFTDDGRLLIACYRPDVIYIGSPEGRVEVFIEDLTAELLCRPANIALRDGRMVIANLGGWHLTALPTTLRPAPIHYPARTR